MSEQLFIRLRGRIQGPFSAEQLQSMSQRGQFSRMHEVSGDGITWGRATTRPELFERAQSAFIIEEPELPEPPRAQALPPADVWYYHQLGANHGPVDLDQLQFLANSGQLLPTELVWKQGLPEWIAAARVPGLFKTSGAPMVQSPVYGGTPHERNPRNDEPQSVSGLAITSLVLGILWIGGLGSVLAIIFGAVSIYQIRISKGKVTGSGLAIAGLVLGIVLLSLQFIVILNDELRVNGF